MIEKKEKKRKENVTMSNIILNGNLFDEKFTLHLIE